jgi:hypothetical protein
MPLPFFLLVMASCVAKRAGTARSTVTVTKNTVYQLQVKLMKHDPVDDLPGEYIPNLVHPYHVMYLGNIPTFRPEALMLYFRFSDLKQLQQCRDQLLSTGQVEQMSITKY